MARVARERDFHRSYKWFDPKKVKVNLHRYFEIHPAAYFRCPDQRNEDMTCDRPEDCIRAAAG
jgi:hypothetical protein